MVFTQSFTYHLYILNVQDTHTSYVHIVHETSRAEINFLKAESVT